MHPGALPRRERLLRSLQSLVKDPVCWSRRINSQSVGDQGKGLSGSKVAQPGNGSTQDWSPARASSPLPTRGLSTGRAWVTPDGPKGFHNSEHRPQTGSSFPISVRLPQGWWVLESHQHLHQLTSCFPQKLLGWTSSSSFPVPAAPTRQLESVTEPSFAWKTANSSRQGDVGVYHFAIGVA